MIEHEQVSLILNCDLCSETEDKWGRKDVVKRRFVSNVSKPNKFVCSSCGYSTILTDEVIKKLEQKQENKMTSETCVECGHKEGSHNLSKGCKQPYRFCKIKDCKCEKFIPKEAQVPQNNSPGGVGSNPTHESDSKGSLRQVLNHTSETCANCGHEKDAHMTVSKSCDYCECKKFIPSQGMTQEVPQNHSPQNSGYPKSCVTGALPVRTEDTTQVVNDRINSSGSVNEIKHLEMKYAFDKLGSDDEFKDIRWKDESLSNKIIANCMGTPVVCTKIIKDVKESVQKFDKFKSKNHVTGKHDVFIIPIEEWNEIFGKELI